MPKRDELLLRTVFALPSASSSGLVSMRVARSFMLPPPLSCSLAARAPDEVLHQLLVRPVLPAPTRRPSDWLWPWRVVDWNDISAMAYTCGSSCVQLQFLYTSLRLSS